MCVFLHIIWAYTVSYVLAVKKAKCGFVVVKAVIKESYYYYYYMYILTRFTQRTKAYFSIEPIIQ